LPTWEPDFDPELRLKRLEERLQQVRDGTIRALIQLLDLKDLKTGLYSRQLADWAERVAEHMGVGSEQLSEVGVAALLHDIGKIGVPDSILQKPGPLGDEELALIRRHPEFGWAILNSIPGFEKTSLLVLHHHERFDGKGYPAGLAGKTIPIGARIVSVVDTLDAMLSDRPYRPSYSIPEALVRLEPEAGSQFDPDVLGYFIEIASRHLEDHPG
jgi:HD-GYP domain-containing protein (c-di-GMP phosphodiesterase class II)